MEDDKFNQEIPQEEPSESLQPVEPESPPAEPAEAESSLPPRPEDTPLSDEPGLAATPEPMDDILQEAEQQKEPTKFQRFLRKALIWLGVGVVLFAAGFATFYFTLYRPKADALNQTEAQLTQAQSDVQSLESDLADANSQLDALAQADAHRALLSVIADIYAARLALTEEDTVSAKSALLNTADTLNEITDQIAAFDSGLATTLPQRLNIIITNIDRDAETAISDCDQMLKDLKQVETALFK